MEFRRYLQTLRRRWPVVVLSLAVAVAVAVVVSPSKQTRYTATSTVVATWVQPGQSSPADQAIGVNVLLPTYARLVATFPVAQAAISATGAPRTPGQVVGETLANPIQGTQLIAVTVGDSSSSVAQQLSAAMAKAFVSTTGGAPTSARPTSGPLSFAMASAAGSATASTSGGIGKSLGVAVIFGLLVALVLVFLADYTDRTLRDGDAAEEALGAPLLGVIPPLGSQRPFLDATSRGAPRRLPVPSNES
jgi:capsular polysaccharide biosynthesis protein